ncbi:hypothetical protein B0H16DRAFT_1697715 [Mycena metata]|uniref:Uncharacterized protein n=1 Tax=Mycena metata TaxID=1033252 RepID=A0AAD7HST1_9AGAR|nr:hypothetical protein B0H16DRAFT_1697715 [Mycena metata]
MLGCVFNHCIEYPSVGEKPSPRDFLSQMPGHTVNMFLGEFNRKFRCARSNSKEKKKKKDKIMGSGRYCMAAGGGWLPRRSADAPSRAYADARTSPRHSRLEINLDALHQCRWASRVVNAAADGVNVKERARVSANATHEHKCTETKTGSAMTRRSTSRLPRESRRRRSYPQRATSTCSAAMAIAARIAPRTTLVTELTRTYLRRCPLPQTRSWRCVGARRYLDWNSIRQKKINLGKHDPPKSDAPLGLVLGLRLRHKLFEDCVGAGNAAKQKGPHECGLHPHPRADHDHDHRPNPIPHALPQRRRRRANADRADTRLDPSPVIHAYSLLPLPPHVQVLAAGRRDIARVRRTSPPSSFPSRTAPPPPGRSAPGTRLACALPTPTPARFDSITHPPHAARACTPATPLSRGPRPAPASIDTRSPPAPHAEPVLRPVDGVRARSRRLTRVFEGAVGEVISKGVKGEGEVGERRVGECDGVGEGGDAEAAQAVVWRHLPWGIPQASTTTRPALDDDARSLRRKRTRTKSPPPQRVISWAAAEGGTEAQPACAKREEALSLTRLRDTSLDAEDALHHPEHTRCGVRRGPRYMSGDAASSTPRRRTAHDARMHRSIALATSSIAAPPRTPNALLRSLRPPKTTKQENRLTLPLPHPHHPRPNPLSPGSSSQPDVDEACACTVRVVVSNSRERCCKRGRGRRGRGGREKMRRKDGREDGKEGWGGKREEKQGRNEERKARRKAGAGGWGGCVPESTQSKAGDKGGRWERSTRGRAGKWTVGWKGGSRRKPGPREARRAASGCAKGVWCKDEYLNSGKVRYKGGWGRVGKKKKAHPRKSHNVNQSYGWSSCEECAVKKNAAQRWDYVGGRVGAARTINEMIPRRAAHSACGLDGDAEENELHAVDDEGAIDELLDELAEGVHGSSYAAFLVLI